MQRQFCFFALSLLFAVIPLRAGTVTNTNDSGAGSLRQAISDAAPGETITFAASVTGMITLTTAELAIDKDLTISGPGAGVLTVQRSSVSGTPRFRVFRIAFGYFNVTISGLTISGGSPLAADLSGHGGGVRSQSTGTVTVANCSITGNAAGGHGGAVANDYGVMTVTGCTVSTNSAALDAGGIENIGGAFNVANTTISNNTCLQGGGIANSGLLHVNGCTFSSNHATGANGNGGGLVNFGTALVSNSTFSGNTATRDGGGTENVGTMTVTGSTLAANSAVTGGGIDNDGTVTVTNCTISGNNATGANGGGGIYNANGPSVTLVNTTIASNSATIGGGLRDRNSSVTSATKAENTIIAGNTATTGPDVSGQLNSQGWNLIGNNKDSTITASTADQIGTAAAPIDPMLDVLANNGGPAQTRALMPGSPAIDQGAFAAGVMSDQRGLPRPVDDGARPNAVGGNGSDVGAFEVQIGTQPAAPCTAANIVVTNNADAGAGSLRDAITSACDGSTVTFHPSVTGTIDLTSGELVISKNLTITGPGASVLTVERSTADNFPDVRVLRIASGDTNVSITGLTIAHGSAANNDLSGNGGGILNQSTGFVLIDRCTFSENNAFSNGGSNSGNGGGVKNLSGVMTITNSIFSQNGTNGGYGSAVDNDRIATMIGDSMQDGYASNGAVGNAGTANLINSVVSGNFSNVGAGGVLNFGAMYLSGDTIQTNTAFAAGGGGVQNTSANMVILASTISGNTAFNGGGIMQNRDTAYGNLTVINSTISGNVANASNGLGGGISNDGTLNLINSTVATNSAGYGGGLYNARFANLRNTILATNTAPNSGPDVLDHLTSLGHNIIGNNSGATITPAAGDQIGTAAAPIDPQLGTLANNGGPTDTMALLAGSPARDTGDDCVAQATHCGDVNQPQILNEQRGSGFPRLAFAHVDIGAFEVQAPPQLLRAVSRMTHAGAGDFDITLPLTGNPGVECRAAAGTYTLVFTFTTKVISGSANWSGTLGSGAGTTSYNGTAMTVQLSGVADQQQIQVTLNNLTDVNGGVLPNAAVNVKILRGDVNGDSSVNSADTTIARNASGQSTSATNFRNDMNRDGAINSADATIIRNSSGRGLSQPLARATRKLGFD